MATYEWRKIIIVRTQNRFGGGGEDLHLSYDVHEIAPKPGDSRLYVERVRFGPAAGEESIREFGDRTTSNPRHGVFVLLWSIETEAALADVKARLMLLRQRLVELVGAEDAPAGGTGDDWSAWYCSCLTPRAGAMYHLLPNPKFFQVRS